MGRRRGLLDAPALPLQQVRAASLALLACFAAAAAGCRPAAKDDPRAEAERLARRSQKAAQPSPDEAKLRFKTTGSDGFKVTSEDGKLVLFANLGSMEGTASPTAGLEGVVLMKKVKARLFEKGKPQLDLTTPEATWDGKQLVAKRDAHITTPDGTLVMDAATASWNAKTTQLDLRQAKLQRMNGKRLEFTAEGKQAAVLDRWVHIREGAKAYNPGGQRLTSQKLSWHLDRGSLTASGGVELLDDGTRVTGNNLVANTKLQRGRLTGNTRLVTSSLGRTAQARRKPR